MAKDKGILLNPETNDVDIVVIRDADGKIIQGFHVGDVTAQNARTIIYTQLGEIKEYLAVGVGIDNMLLLSDPLLYKHRIRQQLDNDGMQVNRLDINGQNIEIDAHYK